MVEVFSQEVLITAMGTSLVTVVGILWKRFITMTEEHKARAATLETELKETNERVLTLTEKVGEAAGYKEGVEDIASALLTEIKENIK